MYIYINSLESGKWGKVCSVCNSFYYGSDHMKYGSDLACMDLMGLISSLT